MGNVQQLAQVLAGKKQTQMKELNLMDELLPIIFIGWVVASWITHIIVCLKTASWGFLIAGAILFPIAWIHGTAVWLGIV